jgi:hypothetical protein
MNRTEIRLLCYLLGFAGFVLFAVGLLGGGLPARQIGFVTTGLVALVASGWWLRSLARRRRRRGDHM